MLNESCGARRYCAADSTWGAPSDGRNHGGEELLRDTPSPPWRRNESCGARRYCAADSTWGAPSDGRNHGGETTCSTGPAAQGDTAPLTAHGVRQATAEITAARNGEELLRDTPSPPWRRLAGSESTHLRTHTHQHTYTRTQTRKRTRTYTITRTRFCRTHWLYLSTHEHFVNKC